MKLIKTIDAVGQVLCHDITQIIPGEFKGRKFKKLPHSKRRRYSSVIISW